jgi:hypothetical protein
MMFEAFKFKYVGPIDGHRLERLIETFNNTCHLEGPILVHVLTVKGKGYEFAEKDPAHYHGVGCFEIPTGSSPECKPGVPPSYTKIFGETCPHYLLLNRNTNLGNLAKVNPPLRSSEDQERLWLGIKEGTIDTVGSDHVVQMRESKEGQSLWEAKLGFAGMGATLSLLISQGVNRGKISWEKLVKITSENTAKIFHLYPKKGALLPGADADIVIVDPEEEWKLGADCLQSASNFSVYEGIKVKGRVKKTFVRGMLIAEDARLVAEEPNGNYIFPIW